MLANENFEISWEIAKNEIVWMGIESFEIGF